MGIARLATLFDSCGRLSRRAYGRFMIRMTGLSAALLCVAIGLGAQGWRTATFAAFGGISVVLLTVFAQTIRRLHDRDRTGWWVTLSLVLTALNFVPVETLADAYPLAIIAYALVTLGASLWIAVETLGRRGTAGSNRYGPETSDC